MNFIDMCSIFKIANQPSVCWPVLTPQKKMFPTTSRPMSWKWPLCKSWGNRGSSMTFPWLFHDFSMEGNRGAKESLEFGISDVINIYIYIYIKYLSKPFKWRLKLKKSIENGGGEISLWAGTWGLGLKGLPWAITILNKPVRLTVRSWLVVSTYPSEKYIKIWVRQWEGLSETHVWNGKLPPTSQLDQFVFYQPHRAIHQQWFCFTVGGVMICSWYVASTEYSCRQCVLYGSSDYSIACCWFHLNPHKIDVSEISER